MLPTIPAGQPAKLLDHLGSRGFKFDWTLVAQAPIGRLVAEGPLVPWAANHAAGVRSAVSGFRASPVDWDTPAIE